MKNLKNSFLLLLLSLAVWACQPASRLANNNLAASFETPAFGMIHGMEVYASGPDSVDVFILADIDRIPVKTQADGVEYRTMDLNFMIFPSYAPNERVTDSSTITIGPYSRYQTGKVVITHTLRAPQGKAYSLAWKLSGRFVRDWAVMHFSREYPQDEAHFLVTDSDTLIRFRPFTAGSDSMRIMAAYPDERDSIFISLAELHRPFPFPPFEENTEPLLSVKKSVVNKVRMRKGISDLFVLEKPGIYFIQLNTMQPGAMALHVAEPKWKGLARTEALRYITTPGEWQGIQNEVLSPWDFWESLAGSTQRALRMAQIFHDRVDAALLRLGETVPGHMTERGMIFIVYGAPDAIYANDITETWVYSAQRTEALRFDFRRMQDFPAGYRYELVRSKTYRKSWMEAVEKCRR